MQKTVKTTVIIRQFQLPTTIGIPGCTTPVNVSFADGQFRLNGQQTFPIGWLSQDNRPPDDNTAFHNIPFNQVPRRLGETNAILQYSNTANSFGYIWRTNDVTQSAGTATFFQNEDEMDIIIPLTIEYLNGLQRVGLRAIIDVPRHYPGYDGRRLAHSRRPIPEIIRFINALQNHCAVLGWYLADEPEAFTVYGETESYNNPVYGRPLYDAIHAADPNHPVFVISFAPTFVPADGPTIIPEILRNYDNLFYAASLPRFYDVILRENLPFITSNCPTPNTPCFDLFSTNINYQYQQRLGRSYIDIPGISAIGLASGEANTLDLYSRPPSVLERYANNFSSIYFAQTPKSATRQPNIASMIFNSYSMSFWADNRQGTPVVNSTGAALSFIEFFMQNNLDKIIAAPEGSLGPVTAFMQSSPFQDHQMLTMVREWGDSYYIIVVNMVNNGTQFQSVHSLELSWQTTAPVGTTSLALRPPGMPFYTSPDITRTPTPDPGLANYILTDNTPFQPAETRIYRIRKTGSMVAEKSVSSLTGFNGMAQQQAALAKERSDALIVSISPNPTEDESHISFSLQKTQHIRLILTDVLGRTLQTIYEGQAGEGESTFIAHLDSLPSGLYWVRLLTLEGAKTLPLSVRK